VNLAESDGQTLALCNRDNGFMQKLKEDLARLGEALAAPDEALAE
jgi:hypothetical protein